MVNSGIPANSVRPCLIGARRKCRVRSARAYHAYEPHHQVLEIGYVGTHQHEASSNSVSSQSPVISIGNYLSDDTIPTSSFASDKFDESDYTVSVTDDDYITEVKSLSPDATHAITCALPAAH